jgi:RimJ/RimL family protein N-acetyltransferase
VNPPETFELRRIRLRRPVRADAAAIFEYGSDPQVAYFMDWPVCTHIEQIVESLLRRGERWETGEEYYWVITLRQQDRAIGGISCYVRQDAAEIGYLLNRRYWGRGYTSQAAQAVVGWLLSLPTIREVWATCDTENLASARVLEKAGLSRQGILEHGIVRPNISSQPRPAYRYSYMRPIA